MKAGTLVALARQEKESPSEDAGEGGEDHEKAADAAWAAFSKAPSHRTYNDAVTLSGKCTPKE